jgi:non-homologous end joining protein Ku
MIHEPSGKPVRYVKGVRDGDEFTEVPEEEIVKGYEHAKGHHVLIDPSEPDELKLEAKHNPKSIPANGRSPISLCLMVTKPTSATP